MRRCCGAKPDRSDTNGEAGTKELQKQTMGRWMLYWLQEYAGWNRCAVVAVVVMMAMVVINGKYSFIYIFEQSMSYDAPPFQL